MYYVLPQYCVVVFFLYRDNGNTYWLMETEAESIYNDKETSEEETSPQRPLLANDSPKQKHPLIVYSLLFACMACYTVGVISAQVSGMKTNICQLISLSYILQFVGVLCCFPVKGYCLKISKEHIGMFIGAIIANIVYTTCFLFAASFMPVGNLDAFFVAIYMVSATCYDLYKNSITKKAVVRSAIILVGIVIMAQPWAVTETSQLKAMIPCDYLDSLRYPNHTNTIVYLVNETNQGVDHKTSVQKETLFFGCGLILIAALASTFYGNFIKLVTTQYAALSAMFWITLSQGILSFLISLVWLSFTGESFLFLPSGRYCRMFTILVIVSIASAKCFVYASYKYIPISTVALGNAFVSVVLYICQRTFLSAFHPGHANLPEVFGLITVLFGGVCMPFILLFTTKKSKDTTDK